MFYTLENGERCCQVTITIFCYLALKQLFRSTQKDMWFFFSINQTSESTNHLKQFFVTFIFLLVSSLRSGETHEPKKPKFAQNMHTFLLLLVQLRSFFARQKTPLEKTWNSAQSHKMSQQLGLILKNDWQINFFFEVDKTHVSLSFFLSSLRGSFKVLRGVYRSNRSKQYLQSYCKMIVHYCTNYFAIIPWLFLGLIRN